MHINPGNVPPEEPGEITQLLLQLKQGNRLAEEPLFALLYRDLRRAAAAYLRRENPDHTLQPTALVHEAYLRLTRMQEVDWQCRAHFLGVAANIMKHILIDHARAQDAKKRGKGLVPVSFNDGMFARPERPADWIALDDALDELAKIFPIHARVVEMKYFGDMSEEEIGLVLDKGSRTIRRYYAFAKSFLKIRLSSPS